MIQYKIKSLFTVWIVVNVFVVKHAYKTGSPP